MNDVVISCRNLVKQFSQGDLAVPVLKGVNLDLRKGEMLAIVGASGSGKSTLLQLMGTLDVPSSGSIVFRGEDISTLGWKERAAIRNRDIGFVFQFHHLLPEFSARENVAMPGIIGGMHRKDALAKADVALTRVGLAHRLHHRVTTLSGGERQRAAIARAIRWRLQGCDIALGTFLMWFTRGNTNETQFSLSACASIFEWPDSGP